MARKYEPLTDALLVAAQSGQQTVEFPFVRSLSSSEAYQHLPRHGSGGRTTATGRRSRGVLPGTTLTRSTWTNGVFGSPEACAVARAAKGRAPGSLAVQRPRQ
jgi:hypothetical protein